MAMPPVAQRCPECGQYFMGSDCIGKPCPSCTPVADVTIKASAPSPEVTPHEARYVQAAQAFEAGLPTANLNELAVRIHRLNARWWHDLKTGVRLTRNKGELLMLVVSELVEAMEGERKELMDDHLPHRRMAEVELADAMIRILDYAAGHGYDIEGALREKLAYNVSRMDHSAEARMHPHGKKF